jgi:VanZ family protein
VATEPRAWLRRPAPWRALLLLMLATVSWFAFAPVHFDDGELPLDKARHLLAFAALAWVATQGWGRVHRAGLAAALLAYGVFIELVQSQVPGRHASTADVLADALGIALGLLLARAFSPVAGGPSADPPPAAAP